MKVNVWMWKCQIHVCVNIVTVCVCVCLCARTCACVCVCVCVCKQPACTYVCWKSLSNRCVWSTVQVFCITSCRAHAEILATVYTCGLLPTRPLPYFQQICCLSHTGQHEPLLGSGCPVWDMQHICTCTCKTVGFNSGEYNRLDQCLSVHVVLHVHVGYNH